MENIHHNSPKREQMCKKIIESSALNRIYNEHFCDLMYRINVQRNLINYDHANKNPPQSFFVVVVL